MKKVFKEKINGFTLVELLVVVLIIGILAAIAVPQYRIAVEKARVAEGLMFLGKASQAISRYVMANPNIERSVFTGPNQDSYLDIDLPESKYLDLHAYCSYSDCLVGFDGYMGEDRNSAPAYSVSISRPIVEDGSEDLGHLYQWHSKYCYGNTEIGGKICKSLESHGFTAYY